MKKLLCLLIAILLLFSLAACDGESHEGEAKTPSGSSVMAGQHYEDVVRRFEEKGFTNIKLVPIDDLILGWLTQDGDVEDVSVGGDVNYSPDKWVPADTEVIIRYHTFPIDTEEVSEPDPTETSPSVTDPTEETSPSTEETVPPTEETTPPTEEATIPETTETAEETLTISNCPDLAKLLSLKDPFDPFVKEFSTKHKGKLIEFDGNIAYLSNHGSYKTRYDILIYAGDYSETSVSGPNFQFVDVNMSDLNFKGTNVPDYIGIGDHLHLIAKVSGYNENSGLFELKPVSTMVR